MKREKLEVVRGSGNVFADFGHPNAAVEQLKALLAAQIVKVLDARELSVRQAAADTGIAAADFSRIRTVKLDRFTVDRLMTVLERLDQRIEVKIKVKPAVRRRLCQNSVHRRPGLGQTWSGAESPQSAETWTPAFAGVTARRIAAEIHR